MTPLTFLSVLLLLALVITVAAAKKPTSHPHVGILSAHNPGPFDVELGPNDLKEVRNAIEMPLKCH